MILYRVVVDLEHLEGASDWLEAPIMPGLRRWIRSMNQRHGPKTHRIERRNVGDAVAMVAEALRESS